MDSGTGTGSSITQGNGVAKLTAQEHFQNFSGVLLFIAGNLVTSVDNIILEILNVLFDETKLSKLKGRTAVAEGIIARSKALREVELDSLYFDVEKK